MKHICACASVLVCVGDVGAEPPIVAPVPYPFIFWLPQYYPIHPKLSPPHAGFHFF